MSDKPEPDCYSCDTTDCECNGCAEYQNCAECEYGDELAKTPCRFVPLGYPESEREIDEMFEGVEL